MSDNIQKKREDGSRKYHGKPYYRPKKKQAGPGENAAFNKHMNHTKVMKAKKPSEETAADIQKDIERIEKEIELEIKEIRSAKLAF